MKPTGTQSMEARAPSEPSAEARTPTGLAGLIPTVSAGLVLGVLEVFVVASFAALVFAGTLARHLPSGIGLGLFAATAVMTVVALTSSIRGAVGSVQDTPAALTGLAAASLAAGFTPGDPRIFPTVVMLLAVVAVLAGALFLLLGTFGFGNLVRFVPFPVIGGFLAGTGWLIVKGGLGILTQTSLTLNNVSAYFQGDILAKWLPGLGFAVLVLFLVRRVEHVLLVPGAVVAGIALFYAVALAAGRGPAELEATGWLLGPFPERALWEPHVFSALGTADWSAILGQAANIVTLLVVALLSLLMNASGIELATDTDADFNRELQTAGLANVAGGVGGGLIGYQTLALTVLANRMGSANRAVGLIAAGVCGATLLFGAAVLSLFPRTVLGGLVVFLGLGFIIEWAYDAWFRLPKAEYAVVVLILVAIATIGFLPGVAVGVALAIVLFVVDYSRMDVAKHTLSGATFQSNTDRDPKLREALRSRGDEIHILELQGFLFFGTAASVVDRIRARAMDPDAAPLRYLILDFRRVSGLDSSAALSFEKAKKVAESRGFVIVLTGASPRLRDQLVRSGLNPDDTLRILPDLDRGVEWCEDQILGGAEAGVEGRDESVWSRLGLHLVGAGAPERLMGYLQRLEVPQDHTLIHQGEASEDIYFLESGRLSAVLEQSDGGAARLRAMGPGTVVGEVAMYVGSARAASVVADAPSVVYRLSREALEEMERRDPELAAALHRLLAGLLAERLADTLKGMQALLD